ncbi:hypothetical protein N7470_009249 [Penicillium chermesinum]|nr:hypothetical protein N7470_009249 [Penicillium chermesinum]
MQHSHSRKASEGTGESRPRRFSLLPASFSIKGLSSRAQTPDEIAQTPRTADPQNQRPATGPPLIRPHTQDYVGHENMEILNEGPSNAVHQGPKPNKPENSSYEAHIDQQFAELGSRFEQGQDQFGNFSSEEVHNNDDDQYAGRNYTHQSKPSYYDDYNGTYESLPRQSMQAGRGNGRGANVLQKNNRKFADAYEFESHHSGSSGAARKVMDFFRRRAKSRAGDER